MKLLTVKMAVSREVKNLCQYVCETHIIFLNYTFNPIFFRRSEFKFNLTKLFI